MTIQEVSKFVKKDMREQLSLLLKGKIAEYQSNHVCINDVAEYLKSKGFEDEDFDTNGWQYDFWKRMTHPNHGTYIISGSGYYGGLSVSNETTDLNED